MIAKSGARAAPSGKRLGSRLFSFAVIADTHLNQGEEDCNSPFDVNRLANARMRHVVHDLNTRDVAFVVHLGDIVHPVPAIPDLYEEATRRFYEQVEDLRHRLYLVPGNHDIGDKPNPWAPTGVVSEAFIALWKRHFGEQYFAFTHRDCHFVVLDAQIMNSGLSSEAEQRLWIESFLQEHRGARIFVNLHYPPFLGHADEPEHYDNIAEPARSWLLGLLETSGVEGLFAGHVHNFWYDRHGVTDLYFLPSTAFVRQDYSEMFRCPPGLADEAGRNDKPKLGYFLMHVHEGGHLCEVVRTYGRAAESGGSRVAVNRISPLHPLINDRAPLGFDMRQSWLERVEIAPTGGLDEFDRKAVRNDYPLMALWEMGVRKLRVPMQDIRDPHARQRMRLLHERGLDFTLFSFGVPDEAEWEVMSEISDIISCWEVAYNPHSIDELAPRLLEDRHRFGIPIYLSRLRSKEDVNRQGERYYHVINHGFLVEEDSQLRELLGRRDLDDAIDGFVFRLAGAADPWDTVLAAGRLSKELGVGASVHLRVSGANPAEAAVDDRALANRIAGALVAALTQPDVSVFVDTFADNDRGYFVRNGVVDRLFNPRPAYHVVRNLYGALNASGEAFRPIESAAFHGGTFMMIGANSVTHALVLPDRDGSGISLPRPEHVMSVLGRARLSDLLSGNIASVDYHANAQGELEVTGSFSSGSPMLLTLG